MAEMMYGLKLDLSNMANLLKSCMAKEARDCDNSVSYTHLDVYKRQELISFFYITVLFGLFWTFVYIFTEILELPSLKLVFNYASNVLLIIYLVVSFSLFIRRLHDFGKSSIYLFVPLYNIVLLLQEGDKKANKYGEVPV